MIIVDEMLEKRAGDGRPIQVGLVGAGFMGRGIARQILRYTRGMNLACVFNRHAEKALQVLRDIGVDNVVRVKTGEEIDRAVERGQHAVTDRADALSESARVEALIEATGTVEFAARVVLAAIEHGKHVVSLNAELDGTLGPILHHYARQAGTVYTTSDGDQPGVTMNLFRFVRGIGATPAVCGNIKGFHDPYRTPETQAEFARKWGQKPHMVTSFADGSKVSFEQAVIANATGMRVVQRGMVGPTVDAGTPIEEAMHQLPLEQALDEGPFVDYIVGPRPSPGVFVVATYPDPVQQHYLELYKLGQGPFYCFYRPYHLCHFEVPSSVARAVDCHDATLAPISGPLVDVVASAKRSLQPGEVLDPIGHFMTYGVCENSDVTIAERLLPMGLVEGCRVLRPIERDQILTYDDIELPEGRLADRLRREQAAQWPQSSTS
jgi:predicted homoserine dehydrogenase-like protein